MEVSQRSSLGRYRRMNRRRKKKVDLGAVEHEADIVGVGGYDRCFFLGSSASDCDLCANASPALPIYAANSSAGEGGVETDHYACPSCALVKTQQIRAMQAWWKSAVQCPACAEVAKHLAFDLMPPQCEHCAPYGLVSPEKAAAIRVLLAK